MFLVRISIKREWVGAFFVISDFLNIIALPRNKLEFLGQLLIKWNIGYWLNTSLSFADTCFKQQCE